MEYPKLEELNSSNCTERSIEIHYPEFWKYIIDNYHHSEKWTERIYWFYYGLNDFPKCPICGKRTNFINLKNGYREFCSTKCLNNSKDIQLRKKQTTLKKYGVDNPMKCDDIKSKLKNTIKKKYGVDNVFRLDEVKNKIKQTCLDRYGETHALKCENIKYKLINTIRNKNINNDDNLIEYDDNGYQIRSCPHKDCKKCKSKKFVIPASIYYDRKRMGTELCTNLLGVGEKGKSGLEYKIMELLESLNIEYIHNDRKTMHNGKELDIYIPSKNLAIECNGIWAHSTMNNKDPKPYNYHRDKTIICKKYNINLLHIWEDWMIYKWDIVKSMIINKLGLIPNIIYARNCNIRNIDFKNSSKFLQNNHIQGSTNIKYNIGLYYNDELVALMGFNKKSDNTYELVRFCNKINTRVVGGASKLLNYFIKTYHPTSIVSFSSNDISDGNLYKELGFITDGKINNSYWYIEPKTYKRYHRSSFAKREIVKRGWKDEVNNTWTENEAMKERGYFQIYDSGQLKWILNLS